MLVAGSYLGSPMFDEVYSNKGNTTLPPPYMENREDRLLQWHFITQSRGAFSDVYDLLASEKPTDWSHRLETCSQASVQMAKYMNDTLDKSVNPTSDERGSLIKITFVGNRAFIE